MEPSIDLKEVNPCHIEGTLEKTQITDLGQNWCIDSLKVTDECLDISFGHFNGKSKNICILKKLIFTPLSELH